MRTNEDGTTWREPAGLTCRVPPTGGVNSAVVTEATAQRGKRMEGQRLIDFDGIVRTVTLPVPEGPGQWRAIVEDGRRLYAFQRDDGSRFCINLD